MIKNNLKKAIEIIDPSILFSSKSYSQHGEDMLLKSYFPNFKNYKGFYIDIGAHHPYRFSNTAFFYNNGWRGINIEPDPNLINAFKRVRKRDITLQFGVSDTESILPFYKFSEPALNSFDRELSELRDNTKNKYKIVSETKIQVYPLAKILEKYLPENQHIDFMNIDVEGLDLNVLKSNDWSKYIPQFILIEGEFDVENISKGEIYRFLKDKDYDIVGRTKESFLFKRNSF